MSSALPLGNSSRLAFSLDEVASLLGISRRTVQREIQRGKLPVPIRIASKPMILADELNSIIDRKKRERKR
jgi:predicted site-specific integrase-resolvase